MTDKCENCLSKNVCRWYENGTGKNLCCADDFPCPEQKDKDHFIKVPCKVGDMVYVISRYYAGDWEVYKCEIDAVTVYENNTFISCIANDVRFGKINFGLNISEIGKTVFLTKEEAEAELRKRVKENV